MRDKKIKKSSLKNAITAGLFSVFLVFVLNGSAFAATTDPDAGKAKDSSGANNWKCFKKGGQDFMTFLNSTMFSEGFSDSVIEPWKDVLFRNQCHALDVLGLVKQQDKIRSAIRDAYLMCKNQKIPKLKTAFNRMSAEIYYVRNAVDADLAATLPFDSSNLNAAEKNPEELKKEMKAKFLDKKKFDNAEDFNNFFNGMVQKYEDRLDSYTRCNKGSWQAVKDKFTEFVKFFSEGMGVKEGYKSWQRKAAKLKQTATQGWEIPFKMGVNGQEVRLFDGENTFMSDMSSAFEGFGENNPFTEKYWTSDIAKGLQFGDTSSLMRSLELSKTATDLVQLKNGLNQKFFTLYSDFSSSESRKVLESLDELNQAIKQTPPGPLDSVEKCVDGINDMQCKNN